MRRAWSSAMRAQHLPQKAKLDGSENRIGDKPIRRGLPHLPQKASPNGFSKPHSPHCIATPVSMRCKLRVNSRDEEIYRSQNQCIIYLFGNTVWAPARTGAFQYSATCRWSPYVVEGMASSLSSESGNKRSVLSDTTRMPQAGKATFQFRFVPIEHFVRQDKKKLLVSIATVMLTSQIANGIPIAIGADAGDFIKQS